MEQGQSRHILLVEDEKTILMGLEYSLRQAGFKTSACDTASKAKSLILSGLEGIDCCLIDLNLPDGDGYELCSLIKDKRDIPVIFLTAMDDEINVVMGLDMGADDYITKPFRIRELISRIQSVLRRYDKYMSMDAKEELDAGHEISFGPARIHLNEARVYKDGDELILTSLEYRLLILFATHQGQILERNQLLSLIWDEGGSFVNDNTLTVYIKRLREKLEDNPADPKLIRTVRGIGYQAGN